MAEVKRGPSRRMLPLAASLPRRRVTSFLISDILAKPAAPLVRPWQQRGRDDHVLFDEPDEPDEPDANSGESSDEIDVEEQTFPRGADCGKPSPLDALLKMTSKTFQGLDNAATSDSSRRDQLALFAKSQPSKKRRKSRTAFTNQQIYELEKRFLYQKYLTPADRDEIASSLGLSNAQVITWFQNRRAKLKRDLEELKADVSATVIGPDGEVIEPCSSKAAELLEAKHELLRAKNESFAKADAVQTTKTGRATDAELNRFIRRKRPRMAGPTEEYDCAQDVELDDGSQDDEQLDDEAESGRRATPSRSSDDNSRDGSASSSRGSTPDANVSAATTTALATKSAERDEDEQS